MSLNPQIIGATAYNRPINKRFYYFLYGRVIIILIVIIISTRIKASFHRSYLCDLIPGPYSGVSKYDNLRSQVIASTDAFLSHSTPLIMPSYSLPSHSRTHSISTSSIAWWSPYYSILSGRCSGWCNIINVYLFIIITVILLLLLFYIYNNS